MSFNECSPYLITAMDCEYSKERGCVGFKFVHSSGLSIKKLLNKCLLNELTNNSKSILLNLHWKIGVVSVVGIHVALKPSDNLTGPEEPTNK